MESTQSLQERIGVLEHRTRLIEQRLRWCLTSACGLIVLGLFNLPLPLGTAQEGIKAKGTREVADRVTDLENTTQYLSSTMNAEGLPEVVINGANLRIINGLGSTNCTDDQGEPIPDCPNGVGNLIVGYNEPHDSNENIRIGSHNVVVGREHNFSSFGGLVAGLGNQISGEFASVSGGARNTASGIAASVSGGGANTASGFTASVSGGGANTASGIAASVSGGVSNTVSGIAASVSGEANRTATGEDD